MTTTAATDAYRRGLELAEAGRYEEGWTCLQEHLRAAPQDSEALNDAGTILYHLGRPHDAVGVLQEARRLRPDSPEIAGNLLEACLGAGRAVEAAGLLNDLERMGTLDIDVLNRTAALLLDQGHKAPAVEVLLHSQQLWPGQEVLGPMLDAIRARRPKVAFFGAAGRDGFLGRLSEFARRRFQTAGGDGRDPGETARLLSWSDIVWFDGVGPLAVEVSRRGGTALGTPDPAGTSPRIVVGIREADVQDRRLPDVQWENVACAALLGGPAVEEVLRQQVPDLAARTRLEPVPPGVPLGRYALRRRERGTHLACLDGLRPQANPAFLLQCMQKLHYIDSNYHLFFSGRCDSSLLEQYLRHLVRTLGLTDVVSFEPNPGERNAWLSDKHFIVAAGLGAEGLESVLAAMACGLKPVVHRFPGADRLLPPEHLFDIAEQFCTQVLARDYEPPRYRRLVEQRYPIEGQWRAVDAILTGLEAELDGDAPRAETAVASDRPGAPADPEQGRQA